MATNYDSDQLYASFINKWASSKGCRFKFESFDGRECDHLIDGMSVDDVWGWLMKDGEEPNDDNYGCIEWSIQEGKLQIEFNDYCEFAVSKH